MVELKRFKGCGKSTPGALYVDGEFICFTVENTEKMFPAGVYNLRLTPTRRTMPDGYKGVAYEIFPVEDRTHIKIHVANYWHELEGCVAPNLGLKTVHDAETVQPIINGLTSAIATRMFMQAMGSRDGVAFRVKEV